MFQILALSGSLRAASINTALLLAAARLAPDDMAITLYDGLAALPPFNPDLEVPLPDVVARLHAQVEKADGLLIACPEYARGIPGAFKNALDWLVGSMTFPGKPVALFNASARSIDAQAALRLVLITMSARIIETASMTVPLPGRDVDAGSIISDAVRAGPITKALRDFAVAIRDTQELV